MSREAMANREAVRSRRSRNHLDGGRCSCCLLRLEADIEPRKVFSDENVGEVGAPGAEMPEGFWKCAVVRAGGLFAAGAFAVNGGVNIFAVALPFEGTACEVIADGGLNFRF